MEKLSDRITISTDQDKLDRQFLFDFLTNIYWSQGRTMEEVDAGIKHSLNFGIYLNDKQVGYARVLTDYVFLAYLLDVFIDEEYRGRGYARLLMEAIINEPILKKVKVWRLGTDDAQGLYAKFGFKPVSEPEKFMEKRLK